VTFLLDTLTKSIASGYSSLIFTRFLSAHVREKIKIRKLLLFPHQHFQLFYTIIHNYRHFYTDRFTFAKNKNKMLKKMRFFR